LIPTVHYHVHRSPPFVPIPIQNYPFYTTPSYLTKIHLNIIHLLRLGLPSGLFPSGYPTINLHAFLFSPIRFGIVYMNVNLDRFLNSIIYCNVALSGQTNLNRARRVTAHYRLDLLVVRNTDRVIPLITIQLFTSSILKQQCYVPYWQTFSSSWLIFALATPLLWRQRLRMTAIETEERRAINWISLLPAASSE
jgi:hypothetical protein